MHETIQGRPFELIFNLDEVRISDWEDRKPKKLVISTTARAHNIHHRTSRNVKHISIVPCISASGACLTPYIVTSQDSAPLHRTLEVTGMQLAKYLILKHRDKPYINGDLFEKYIRTVFLSHLLAPRPMHDFGEENAVLLMDNRSPHLAPAVLTLLSSARVRIVTFAPHPRQIFQILDLTLFGVFKRREQDQLPFDDERGTVHFIRKVYHDFRLAMTETNIWGVFRGIGVQSGMVDGVERLSFNEITLRESEGLRELWDMDFPLVNLSVRRRNARFG
jgi:hypothetical protein